MAEQTAQTRRPRNASAIGTVVPGSFRDEEKALAFDVALGDKTKVVKIYKTNEEFDVLKAQVEALADSGEETIFHGAGLGSNARNSVHISLYRIGQFVVEGKLHNIRRSGEGKNPFFGAYFTYTIIGPRTGKEVRLAHPIAAFGELVEGTENLKNGDIVRVGVRNVTTPDTRESKESPTFSSTLSATSKFELVKAG